MRKKGLLLFTKFWMVKTNAGEHHFDPVVFTWFHGIIAHTFYLRKNITFILWDLSVASYYVKYHFTGY
jgi:hypothetical protein